ncbi:MAG TPA: hypothetical protein VJQ43_02415, partial [Thermoplasmata archaeon]|nr:hypothetical protein [Thermoplasmata archaeon]
ASASPTLSVPPGWTNVTGPGSPSARSQASLAFDPSMAAVVMFGGRGTTFHNDTWTFASGHWTALSLVSAPGPRDGASMAYDAATGAMILFGGFNGAYLADTWSFQGGAWTRLHPLASPSARAGAGLAFDPRTGGLILFGGASPGLHNDTWQFRGANWGVVASSLTPPARTDMALSEDPEAGGVVLFGGSGSHALSDTWLLGSGSWVNLSAGATPGDRIGVSSTYDPIDGYLVLFGGASGPLGLQTWAFRAHGWTQLFPPVTPVARSYAGFVFDPVDGGALLFGGMTSGVPLGDAWTYRAAPSSLVWLNVTTAIAPSARTQAGFAYDPADGYVLLFGGENHKPNNVTIPFFHDTWTYRDGRWTQLHPVVLPAARRGAMMEYDAHLGMMVLFGGSNSTQFFNDTWTFHSGVWSHVVTPVAPAPRRSGSLAYDADLGAMVLYGGHNGSGGGRNGWYGVFNDTWLYRSSGWSRLVTSPSPEPRSEALLSFDPTEGQLVLFGGYEQNGSHPWERELNSTWVFHGSAWTNLTLLLGGPAPLHRDGAGFVFDPAASALYLFGGDDNTPNPVNTTWTFAFDRWTPVCNCHGTLFTADHATYDAADAYILTPAGHGATLTTVVLTPTPLVSASAGPNPVDVNHTTRLTAWAGGGVGPLAFAWTLGAAGTASGPSVVTHFPSVGPVMVRLWANGSGGIGAMANLTVQVNASPSATLIVTPAHLALGGAISANGSYSGGAGSVSWSFSGLPPGCPPPTKLSFGCTPSATGNYTITLRVVDATGTAASARANVTVT